MQNDYAIISFYDYVTYDRDCVSHLSLKFLTYFYTDIFIACLIWERGTDKDSNAGSSTCYYVSVNIIQQQTNKTSMAGLRETF